MAFLLEPFNSNNSNFTEIGDAADIAFDYSPPGYLRITKLTKGWGKGILETVPVVLKAGQVFSSAFTFQSNTVGNPFASDDNSNTQVGLFITSVANQGLSPLVWGLHVHGGIMKLSNGDQTVAVFDAPVVGQQYIFTAVIKPDESIDCFLLGQGAPGFMGNIPVNVLGLFGRFVVQPYFTDVVDMNNFLFIG